MKQITEFRNEKEQANYEKLKNGIECQECGYEMADFEDLSDVEWKGFVAWVLCLNCRTLSKRLRTDKELK